jgi:hypothetical protein
VYRDESGCKGGVGFFFREVTFRAYHDYDFTSLIAVEHILDTSAWNILVLETVCYKA